MKLRVIVTGGGTGGHTTPLVAVGKALQAKDVEVIAIAEKTAQPTAVADLKTYYVSAGKFRRFTGVGIGQVWRFNIVGSNFRDLFKVVKGFFESIGLLRSLRPDAIFVKGGYVSLPVGLAARVLNIPYVTHDSDVMPGLTNRILAKGARRNLTGFPIRNYSYDPTKAYQVGVPIQPHFLTITKTEARRKLGIKPNSQHIVVTGGSLGAQAINQAVLQVMDKLASLAYVTHVAGKADVARLTDQIKAKKIPRYVVFDHLDSRKFALHLISADVVITRAGATTLTELATLKKAAIVVPHPFLTGGHQLKNANVLQSNDAARLLHQATMKHDPNLLVVYADELLANTKERQWLGQNLYKVFKHNAAEETAQILVDMAREARDDEKK